MAICKNCLCEKVCKYNDGHNLYCKEDYTCPHFVWGMPDDISDEPIINVKDKWLTINMESQDLGKAIKTCIDWLTKKCKGGGNNENGGAER